MNEKSGAHDARTVVGRAESHGWTVGDGHGGYATEVADSRWNVTDGDGWVIAVSVEDRDDIKERAKARFEFIVRAVNNHDNLVEALANLIAANEAADPVAGAEALGFARVILNSTRARTGADPRT